MADLTITPGKTGPVKAEIVIMTGDFGALEAKEIDLVLSNLKAGVEPISKRAIKQTDGTWLVDGFVIPLPGQWTARINILISDFEIVQTGRTDRDPAMSEKTMTNISVVVRH